MTYPELRLRLQAMLLQVAQIRARIDALQTNKDFFDLSVSIGIV